MENVVSHLYSVVYEKRELGGEKTTISLQSEKMFVVPEMDSYVDIRHAGNHLAGVVVDLRFAQETVAEGDGLGSREYVFVSLK